jgi:tetratricopeptide (TPR) repeat protein
MPNPLKSALFKVLSIALKASVGVGLLFPAWMSHAEPAEMQAEEQLMVIVNSEQRLAKRLEADLAPDKLQTEIELRIEEIRQAYEKFLLRYPDHLYGSILFGKFLRKTNDPEKAHEIFLRLNELHPELAVIHQHIALYASEKGDYRIAHTHFKQAIAIEPDTALFHYQYGEFLHHFRTKLETDGIIQAGDSAPIMQAAFRQASFLEAGNRDFKTRYAESFFDLDHPDWAQACTLWDQLINSSRNRFEKEVLMLQKARVMIALEQWENAQALLKEVHDPALHPSKKQLQEQLDEVQAPESPN